jgi:precorrin-2 dehydrogenase/sirohydrochlorin ferrochelatase
MHPPDLPDLFSGHEYAKRVIAKNLRADMTDAERKLWQYLRANRLDGLHFRRQQVLHGFIVDFYCRPLGLIVEVDGEVHLGQADYDCERDELLAAQRLYVLRLTNTEVMQELPVALAKIKTTASILMDRQEQERKGQPGRALPLGGDGVGVPRRHAFYPIHLNLSGRRCVVVGGGRVAERKVRGLLDAGGAVVVVAPDATDGLRALAADGALRWVASRYERSHLDGAFLVLAATDDRMVNARVVDDANGAGILVNGADAPEDGSFITPALVRRGGLVLTATTSGGSPTLAAVVRERLETEYGAEWEAIAELFGGIREQIKAAGATEAERKDAVRRLLQDSHLRAMLKEGRLDDARAHAVTCLLSWSE